jgi:hypothetical protein
LLQNEANIFNLNGLITLKLFLNAKITCHLGRKWD